MIGKEFLDKYGHNKPTAKPKDDQDQSSAIYNLVRTAESHSMNNLVSTGSLPSGEGQGGVSSDLESLIQQIEYSQIDITTPYDTWLRILFAISDHSGESGRDYAHRISRFHTGYNPVDCDKQFNYCLRAGKSGITIRTLFYIAQQHGILIHSPDPLGQGFAQHYFSDWSSELSIQLSQIPLVKVPPLIQDRGIGSEVFPNSELLLFPVNNFPLPIANFINLASKSINCPSDFIAVPVLTVLATAIGTSHSIQLKKGWIEGPHIFSAVVALPGSKKSPALSFATAPIRDIQRSFVIEYNTNETEYKLQLCAFNIQAELWKKRKPEEKTPEDQPNAPEEPVRNKLKPAMLQLRLLLNCWIRINEVSFLSRISLQLG